MLHSVLLVLHAISAGVLTGAAIHNGLMGYAQLRRNDLGNLRLRRLYPKVLGVAFILTFGLGTIIYPTFRVEVRAGWMDVHLPWATVLFEVKEHLVALAGLVLVYLIPSSGHLRAGEEKADLRFCAMASVFVMLVVCYALITGLFISALEGP